MRKLFLALVLANIVAFIWYGWLRAPAQATHQVSPLPHVQPLKLISELTPAEKQALANASISASTPVAPAVAGNPAASKNAALICASYGPFPSTQAAQSGLTRLQKAHDNVAQRTVPGKVRLGYWVYLPPFGSHHEADAAAKLLKTRGIKDLYVVTDEANRNAISLGVFSDRFGALARQKKIRELGYHPLLTERFRDAPRYWLDAHGAENQLPPASAFSDLDEGDLSIGREACESAGH
ncbi:MAG TPA: SPOR domain-containing protein [Gammaproteobacteria bacterium]|nr:SPOR domain-containing protein [Gammaproteobacteria bacterium]